MAENDQNQAAPVFGQLVAHPQEVSIRTANADRLSKRKAAAALADSVGRTSGASLDRRNTPRQAGGSYESLQAVPDRVAPADNNLNADDLFAFLKAFNFGATSTELGKRTFFSSFGPNILGLGS